MFIILWTMRQEREFLASRATIQAIVGKDNTNAIQSSFTDLAEAFNPYLEGFREEERKRALKRMEREVAGGPLTIVQTGPAIARMNTELIRQKLKDNFKTNFKETPIVTRGR
jgi:hypothetical protein